MHVYPVMVLLSTLHLCILLLPVVFFNYTSTTEIYTYGHTLSLHDALPIFSVTANGVTIKGAGMDKTVLSFAKQTSGAEGLLVTGDDFTLQDIALEDTKGDALKINGTTNAVMRRVRAEWTGGPSTDQGAYGLQPVPVAHGQAEYRERRGQYG